MSAICSSVTPRRTWLFAAGVALLVLSLYLRACVFRLATSQLGAHFNRGANAAWLGVEWVNEAHTPTEITALAADLQRLQIRTVYVFTSYLKPSGQFNPTFKHANDFIAILKRQAPEVKVQAWLGLPLHQPGASDKAYHVDLRDPATQEAIVAFSLELMRLHAFDGVHLDPEPIPSEDEHTLKLLQTMRQRLDLKYILSIAARRFWPIALDAPAIIGRDIGWSAAYYREIAKHVNQIAVMNYDSGLSSPELYRQFAQYQVVAITQALDGTTVELFFGIPTSEEETPSHKPRAENMHNTLQGVIAGLNDLQAKPTIVTGLAIYPYWETDEQEWAIYEQLWLGRK